MTPTTSDKKRDCVIDLLSSDDDENENETETDHNDDDNNNPDDNDNDNDNDDSSFDSDNDLATAAEDDDDDACERKKERFWWSSSSSSSSSGRQHLLREERLHHLEKNVTNTSNKVLQLMLWDVGFNFNIKPHQFEAIRFVAGLKSTFPCVVVVVVLDIDNDNDNDNNSTSTTSLLLLNDTGVSARLRALQLAGEGFNDSTHHNDQKHRSSVLLPTRGLLIADEMGLGKTIEALAGATLRSIIMQKNKHHHDLPNLIVSPQDGIQNQWYDTLIKSGVDPAQITIIGEKTNSQKERTSSRGSIINNKNNNINSIGSTHRNQQRDNNNICWRQRERRQQQTTIRYLLCTRHKIQSEMKKCFNACSSNSNGDSASVVVATTATKSKKKEQVSALFSDVPLVHIEALRNQYLSDKGKERNKSINNNESRLDCVARLVCNIGKALGDKAIIFQTVIVDEAHFCKNGLAYWGLGLALLGQRSQRNALLTGTPYNNGPADMSCLMAYIDPSHEASRIDWWKNATALSSGPAIKEAVSQWRKHFMLRRTKTVISNELPSRSRTNIDVACYASELWIYEVYETKFLKSMKALTKFMENPSPEARRQMKQVFTIMMACMANMRMSLIHPLIVGGREITIQFSPSRKRFLKREERPKFCVFCGGNNPTCAAEKFAAENDTRDDDKHQQERSNNANDEKLLGLNQPVRTHIDLDDEDLDDCDASDVYARSTENENKGPIVPLGPDICQSSESCRHFAHTKCIEINRLNGCITCPRCHDLEKRLHMKVDSRTDRGVYCKRTATPISHMKGFTTSGKIKEAIKWFSTVPHNEKAIIYSFFKGSLDLIEGVISYDLGLECARYDGDINKEDREAELDKFKTTRSCRVLLATVQSGGTGLNITEANHVCFLDRWFNPCVHDQAESRVHRLGQTKDVEVAYLDCNQTVDVVMKKINILKEGNASILLADGTSLGMVASSLGYNDLSGVIGNNLRAIKEMRCASAKDNESCDGCNSPLPPHNNYDLEQKIEYYMGSKNTGRVNKVDKNENDHSEKKAAQNKPHIKLPAAHLGIISRSNSYSREQQQMKPNPPGFRNIYANNNDNDNQTYNYNVQNSLQIQHPMVGNPVTSITTREPNPTPLGSRNRLLDYHNLLKPTMNLPASATFSKFVCSLLDFLYQNDKVMYARAKLCIKDCTERNKKKESGYANIIEGMARRLKNLVGNRYWSQAKKNYTQQKGAKVAQNINGSGDGKSRTLSFPRSKPITQRSGNSQSHSQRRSKQSQHHAVLPSSKLTQRLQKNTLTPKHSKPIIEKVAEKKKRNLDNLKMSRLKRQKNGPIKW